MDNHLEHIKQIYKFDDHPLAIATVELGGQKYVLGGCHNG